MSVYLVPNEGDFSAIEEVAKKAGVTLITPRNVRDFILESSDQTLVIAAVGPEILLVLNRHARQLVDELPSALIGVPNLLYSGEWFTLASTFVSIDWSEMEAKLSKSGHTAFNPEDHEARSVGAVIQEESEFEDLFEDGGA